MKHLFICLLLSYLSCNFLPAQTKNSKIKFGKVSNAELTKTECEYSPDVSAEILLSKGTIWINLENVSYHIHKRFKVYNKDGKDYATVKIPLYAPKGERSERVRGLKAICYNLENGQVVETKLKSDDKFETRKNDYYKELSFVIPNVQVGSIFEYSYEVESDIYSYIDPWQLQFDIPVAQNILEYDIDNAFHYKIYMTGNVYNIESGESAKDNWAFDSSTGLLKSEKIAPIYEEPFQPNMSDVYGKINFQLVRIVPLYKDFSSDYGAMNKTLLNSEGIGKVTQKKGMLRALNLAKRTADIDFAKEILNRLKAKVSWDNYYGKYSENNGKQLINKGAGSVADINLTYLMVLNEAGFLTAPIIASTRGNGLPHPVFADAKRFNYVLAGIKMPDGWVVVDAASNLPLGELKTELLNGDGYILHETLNGWHNLKSGRKSSESIFIQAQLKEGVYTESVSIKYGKYAAFSIINQIKEDGAEAFKKDFIEDFEKPITDFTVSEPDYDKPLVIKFNVSETYDSEDILYLEPISYGGMKKNPFEREQRYSNLNFPYSIGEKVIYKLSFDENWEVEPLKNQRVALEGGKAKFNFLASNTANSIDVMCDFLLKDTFYTVEEYPSIKQLFEGYSTLQNELLVLKRK